MYLQFWETPIQGHGSGVKDFGSGLRHPDVGFRI